MRDAAPNMAAGRGRDCGQLERERRRRRHTKRGLSPMAALLVGRPRARVSQPSLGGQVTTALLAAMSHTLPTCSTAPVCLFACWDYVLLCWLLAPDFLH